MMEKVIKKWQQWKRLHPDEDYQYDECHNFMSELSRGEMLSMLNYIEDSGDPLEGKA